MPIDTVGSLRRFLAGKQWSCEVLAQKVPVSNMTWRRLLQKNDEAPLPQKYQALLSGLVEEPQATTIDEVQLVLSGMQQTPTEVIGALSAEGASVDKPQVIFEKSRKRAKSRDVPERLRALLKTTSSAFLNIGRPGQFLILGGLAYFLNPMDLIADPIVGLGFADDVGIFTVIQQRLFGKKAKAP